LVSTCGQRGRLAQLRGLPLLLLQKGSRQECSLLDLRLLVLVVR
jgi:hypothetical protein